MEEAKKEVDVTIQRLFYWGAYADKYGGTVQVSSKSDGLHTQEITHGVHTLFCHFWWCCLLAQCSGISIIMVLCSKVSFFSHPSLKETPFYGATVKIHEPVGVIGITCPDSCPLLAFVSLLAPAVIRGNTVIIIPSHKHPVIAVDMYQVPLSYFAFQLWLIILNNNHELVNIFWDDWYHAVFLHYQVHLFKAGWMLSIR